MKVLALLLSLCMSLNLMAGTGSAEALSNALDEYQYAITVEWDQKDQAVYQKETSAFFEKLGKIVSEEGVSKEEILALAEKKMANKKSFEALKLKLALAGVAESPEQLAKALQESSKEFYHTGASWNGNIDWGMVGIVAVVVAAVAYALWFNANYECGGYKDVWECDTYTSSEGTYSSTSCGWESQCAYYVEK